MNKNKDKQQPKHTRTKKSVNQFKALYKLTQHRRAQNSQQRILNQQTIISQQNFNLEQSKDEKDSLDEIEQSQQKKTKQNPTFINHKKATHSRSNSCPNVHPPPSMIKKQKPAAAYHKYGGVQEGSKRTLKKSSTLHRKNHRVNKKHSIGASQLSQQSNTVIVHSLPMEELSSMLYSMAQEKDHNKRFGSAAQLPQRVLSLNHDLYFQTKLQQQMKMYNLSQQMKMVQKESDNVKIKQDVIQKLVNKFDKQDTQTDDQESLLIH